MSQQRPYQIKCPKCGHRLAVELYESVNVKLNPELKDQLMLNQLNAVTCTECSLAFRVDKPLLYSDPDRKLLVYWLPTPDDRIDDGEDQFSEWMRDMGKLIPEGVDAPHVHLVFSRTELVERIFLMESGLDERAIEYVKYLIYSKNPAKLDPAEKILLFDAQDSTDTTLRFVVQDAKTRQFESALDYGRETYQAIMETFGSGEKSADLLELFPGPYISARATLLRELESEEPPESESGPDSQP